jgi:ADP-ribosyl-[dinitrogen reductase] hydrolase
VSSFAKERVAGALTGLATGDALGAGYEFTNPGPDTDIRMKGGGAFGWEPGEWTDDTQMAICIAEVAATGRLDPVEIGARFLTWFRSGPKDVGNMTSAVLSTAKDPADLPRAAQEYYEHHPRSAAGNGSLMRTAPVALAHLGDDAAIMEAAREVSALTHADPLAQEACVIWCIAIDRAIREERIDGAWDGIELLPASTRDRWARYLEEAETQPPGSFTPNGFVVTALQAAHAVITRTDIAPDRPRACRLQSALRAAVRIGHDTDTVAAIAGQVLGARYGLTAIPFAWRRLLHGWPGHRLSDLVRLAVLTASKGYGDDAGWPDATGLANKYGSPGAAEPLPDDPGVVVGDLGGIGRALDVHGADAVVSLCRVGTDDVPEGIEHHEVMLSDTVDHDANLDFVLCDIVDAIATLRDEGRTVFVHCAGGTSRTPTVAALYLAEHLRISGTEALERVQQVIADPPWNPTFRDAIERADEILGACACDG